ncbi:MAG TPA: preprotein translocase subunit YajC [Chitinophagaceae bacterium]|nr:preprotein translocase subunit YajC [Chitinophagaceae bacterium]
MLYSTYSNLLMTPAGGSGNPTGTIIFMALFVFILYFFMLRPQSKKAKLQKQFNEGIQKGDKIVTIAGIHGRITKVNEDGTIQIEVGPGTFMTIEKSAISMEYTQTMTKRSEDKTKS